MTLPELRTGRLMLRPVTSEDLPAVTRLVGDFDVSKMLSPVPHPYSLDDARAWFGQNASRTENGERAFAIDNGQGLIGAISVGKPEDAPEFGYWLGKSFWGRGFMTEAGRAVLAWLFGTTETATVMSGALKENPASLNVLKKLGFEDAGDYMIPVRARGEELPGNRVMLRRERFLAEARTHS